MKITLLATIPAHGDRDLERRDGFPDRGEPEDLIGAGWLLDPVRVVRRQRLARGYCPPDIPSLVRVHGDAHIRPDRFSRQCQPPRVGVRVAADFELDLGEAVADGLP